MGYGVRRPAVAGLFYPADAGELRRAVEEYLADVPSLPPGLEGPAVKAVIAPHAGYPYSGPVAASAYAPVAGSAGRIERVILLGPAHRFPVRGLALPDTEAFATPLGVVRLDAEVVAMASTLPAVSTLPEAHDGEHSLEVHLPFLQVVLDDFTVVPMVVGQASPVEVAETLGALWGGPETLIVVSSDLSHYHGYDAARALDAATARAIEALDAEAIGRDQACGHAPVAGLLRAAGEKGLQAWTLDLRNSGDTSGDRGRVVGYGAWAFTPASGGGDPA